MMQHATCLALLAAACLVGCAEPHNALKRKAHRFVAASWPQADRLFRSDEQWTGGDGAYSIDLGGGRILWLFGDSIIDPSGAHSRRSEGADMISNTVAIQEGYDPSKANIMFYWNTTDAGSLAAFFPDRRGDRFWPGHGIRIGDRLLLFLMRVRGTTTGLGFEVYDWDAVLVPNPDDEPSHWDLKWLDSPPNELQVIVGSASVLGEGDFAYAFSVREPDDGDAYLVRWPRADVYEGILTNAEWWSVGGRWTTPGSPGHEPTPVLRDTGTEFTVHRDPMTGLFLQVQATGFGAAHIEMRHAADLTGPWSNPVVLYRPPEYDRPQIMIYQGKAHPHLLGGDLILTYSTNSFDFQELIDDESIYYPRFVRLTRAVAE